MIPSALQKVSSGESLSREEAADVMREVFRGNCSPTLLAALLTALHIKEETPSEIAGFAIAMREEMVRVRPSRGPLADNCGTGGGTIPTFNISTAAALVMAGAGVAVAKHGNRAVTSQCGSADVLEALGVRVELGPNEVARCIDRCGIGFLFGPSFHPAMRFAGPVRRELPFRTVFNLLGPLCNPAGASRQVVGTYAPTLTDTLGLALKELGCERAMLVHGSDGLDELTTCTTTGITELKNGQVRSSLINPRDLGLPPATAALLAPGSSVEENAAIIRRVLEGEKGPRRDIVLLNAAAGLVVSDAATDLREGIAMAARSIDRGDAGSALARLAAQSQLTAD